MKWNNDVFWQLDWIKAKISDRILSFLGRYEPKHDNTMQEALAIVLSWNPGDIARFAEEAEKVPLNHRELYELGISRLFDLKADLEEGDTSLAEIFMQVEDERLHRIYIGGWMRDRSNGKYSVSQEEELADRKEPDIRLHGLGFDGPQKSRFQHPYSIFKRRGRENHCFR